MKIAKVVWTEKDKKEWGGTPPTIEVGFVSTQPTMVYYHGWSSHSWLSLVY